MPLPRDYNFWGSAPTSNYFKGSGITLPERGGIRGGRRRDRRRDESIVQAPTKPLDDVIHKWMQREQELKDAGVKVPLEALRAGAQYDVRQLQSGARPLTNPEALAAISAFTGKKGGVHKPKEKDHDFLGMDIPFLGNAVHDIGTVAEALNPVQLVKSGLAEAMAVGKAIGEGDINFTTEVHDPAEAFENLSKTPGVRWLPGIYAGKNITSGDVGEIAQHPLLNLLDILPIASKVGKIAGGYKLGKIEGVPKESIPAQVVEKAMATNKPVLKGIEQVAVKDKVHPGRIAWQPATPEPGSVLEALVAGNPLKAGYRKLKLGEGYKVGSHQVGIEPLAKFLGVSKELREASRSRSVLGRREGDIDFLNNWRSRDERLVETAPTMTEKLTAKKSLDSHPVVRYEREQTKALKLETALERAKQAGLNTDPILKLRNEAARKMQDAHKEIAYYKNAEWGNYLADQAGVAKSKIDALAELKQEFDRGTLQRRYPGIPENEVIQKAYDNEFRTLDKVIGEFGSPKEIRAAVGLDKGHSFEDLVVPKWFERGLKPLKKDLNRQDLSLPARLFDKTENAFKYAVLTGPRHLLHILFSNAMFSMLEQGPTAYRHIRDAYHMVHDPTGKLWPRDLQKGFNEFLDRNPEEAMLAAAQGKTWGRLVKEAGGAPFRGMRHLEERITDMYRAMTYLTEAEKQFKSKGIRPKESTLDYIQGKGKAWYDDPVHQEALNAVTKTLLDIDGMSPVERTVFRRAFPFYAFTRQLMRYMFRYPGDHPTRAAVLANIGRIEAQDRQSGLPELFDNLFFVGSVDDQGNQLAIDTKFANPFRSMDGHNPFTLAGFLSMLNPTFTAPLTATGTNILSATPELYPDLHVDPKTGGLVSDNKGALWRLTQSFLPPIGAAGAAAGYIPGIGGTIQDFLGVADQMKYLKENDPKGAYRRMIANYLNVGGVFPSEYNKNRARIKLAKNYYKQAQQDVSKAIYEEDLRRLDKYEVIPYRGTLLRPDELRKLISDIQQQKLPLPVKNYLPQR